MKTIQDYLPMIDDHERIAAVVEIDATGRAYHVTRDLDADPCGGEEFIVFDEIRVNVHADDGGVDAEPTLLRSVTFNRTNGNLSSHHEPPAPPWCGRMSETPYFTRPSRKIRLRLDCPMPVHLTEIGIRVGDLRLSWHEILECGEMDGWSHEWAYTHGALITGHLKEMLTQYFGQTPSYEDKLYRALLDDIGFIAAHSAPAFSVADLLDAANDDPAILLKAVCTMPWNLARRIMGPVELEQWIEANHPESPKRRMPIPQTPPTPKTVNSFESPVLFSPLTTEGELALNAMLGIMKVKGALTDEMISQEEGEIILGKPFAEWPKELQEKLAPYGAGPAIR